MLDIFFFLYLFFFYLVHNLPNHLLGLGGPALGVGDCDHPDVAQPHAHALHGEIRVMVGCAFTHSYVTEFDLKISR